MRIKIFFVAVFALLLASSCRTPVDLVYVNDAVRDSAVAVQGQIMKGIQVNDNISIYVESETPESTVQFNQETNKIAMSSGAVMNPSSNTVSGYLVNADGDIIFPVLGKIHVAGLTHTELASLIENRLIKEGHIKDPVVTVKLLNFRVCVIGEVTRPGMLHVDGDRMTIFEALSSVGDVTMYGQRKNVTVIREENGQRILGTLDLTSQNVFSSPYYFLHQNDVVYVEPNKRKKRNAERDPMIMTYISSGVSIISVLTSAFYYYIMTKYYYNN